MTPAEAAQFGWDIGGTVLGFVGLVALVMLGFALMREITR